MASLRGGQYLWNNAAVVLNGVSNLAAPGPGPYLTLYVESDTNVTLTLQVATNPNPSAGFNAIGDDVGSSLVWCNYYSKNAPTTAVTIVVTAGTPIALDLSPFGPEFLRLEATTLTGTAHITAMCSSFGPN